MHAKNRFSKYFKVYINKTKTENNSEMLIE